MLPNLRLHALRAVGGAGGIALMVTLADSSGMPLMMVPFASSIVLVLGAPGSPPGRPRSIAGGHLIAAASGLLCSAILGPVPAAAAAGVGLAMLLMLALDAFHPPAGITPVLIANTHANAWFIVSPVATGIAVLLLYAFIFHRLSGERWPERWS